MRRLNAEKQANQIRNCILQTKNPDTKPKINPPKSNSGGFTEKTWSALFRP